MSAVVKRNGRRQKFDEKKLRRSVEKAASEAGIPEKRRLGLADSVSIAVVTSLKGKKEIPAQDIREMVLARLDRSEPLVARHWRDFDRETKGLP